MKISDSCTSLTENTSKAPSTSPIRRIHASHWSDILDGKENLESPPPAAYATDAEVVVIKLHELAKEYINRLATIEGSDGHEQHVLAASPGYGVGAECKFISRFFRSLLTV